MELKHWLYFGLGTLATLPFALRSLLQWFLSEYRQKSHVTLSFWIFSIIGNVMLLTHYLVQIQFHLYFIRIFPCYFAIRQIALIKKVAAPFSWRRLLLHVGLLTFFLLALFLLRVFLSHGSFIWITNPQMPWSQSMPNVSYLWHWIGFIGAGLFMSRMWVQWWQSEKAQDSFLSAHFWWISLTGSALTLGYALYIQDIVTAIGYGLGVIPYTRNLMLLKKAVRAKEVV